MYLLPLVHVSCKHFILRKKGIIHAICHSPVASHWPLERIQHVLVVLCFKTETREKGAPEQSSSSASKNTLEPEEHQKELLVLELPTNSPYFSICKFSCSRNWSSFENISFQMTSSYSEKSNNCTKDLSIIIFSKGFRHSRVTGPVY